MSKKENSGKTGSRIRLASPDPSPDILKDSRPAGKNQNSPETGALEPADKAAASESPVISEKADRPEKKRKAYSESKPAADRTERTEGNPAGASFSLAGILFLVMAAVYLISVFCYMSVDGKDFSLAYAVSRIAANIKNFFVFATGGPAEGMIGIRVYKMVIIVLSGMGLAAAGAVYKSIFRNTLASPDVMGVQSGGNLGNVMFVLMFAESEASSSSAVYDSSTFFGRNSQGIMVFATCFISVILLSMVASTAGRGRMSSAALVLTGSIFSAIISAFVTMVQYQIIENDADDPRIDIIKNMAQGTFDYSARFEQMVTMAAIILPCILITLALSGKMDVYSLGDDEAMAAGLNVRLYKYVMVIISTAMVAVVMGYCGHIAFVAFLVPQIARKIGRQEFRQVLVNSVLIGGILMLVVYDISVLTHMTDALNVFTTTLGGVVMIIMLAGKRGDRSAAVTQ